MAENNGQKPGPGPGKAPDIDKTPYIIVAALLVVVALGWVASRNSGDAPTGKRHMPILKEVKDFTLRSAEGPVSLKGMQGKAVVVFFGYTSCPEICPRGLATMARAFEGLKDDELDRTRGLLISIDPETDTVERLKEFTANFHTNIIGLTGTPEELQEIASDFGVMFMQAEERGGKGEPPAKAKAMAGMEPDNVKDKARHDMAGDAKPDATNDATDKATDAFIHASSFFLIGPGGGLRGVLSGTGTPESLREGIRGVL